MTVTTSVTVTIMEESVPTGGGSPGRPAGRRLLRRDERRAQLLRAAATAFLAAGYAGTSLEDVAAEAGVTRMIIYRHFDSKRDLYREVLLDTRRRIEARVGPPEQFGPQSVHDLVLAARADPDGFRLLYRHARREPDFAGYVDELGVTASRNADRWLGQLIPDASRRAWIASLLPAVTTDAILTWLDAGQPIDSGELARTIRAVMRTLTEPEADHGQ
jgi:AcrR family transcriptional regulator